MTSSHEQSSQPNNTVNLEPLMAEALRGVRATQRLAPNTEYELPVHEPLARNTMFGCDVLATIGVDASPSQEPNQFMVVDLRNTKVLFGMFKTFGGVKLPKDTEYLLVGDNFDGQGKGFMKLERDPTATTAIKVGRAHTDSAKAFDLRGTTSGSHFSLRIDSRGRIGVSDLGSKNGTKVGTAAPIHETEGSRSRRQQQQGGAGNGQSGQQNAGNAGKQGGQQSSANGAGGNKAKPNKYGRPFESDLAARDRIARELKRDYEGRLDNQVYGYLKAIREKMDSNVYDSRDRAKVLKVNEVIIEVLARMKKEKQAGKSPKLIRATAIRDFHPDRLEQQGVSEEEKPWRIEVGGRLSQIFLGPEDVFPAWSKYY